MYQISENEFDYLKGIIGNQIACYYSNYSNKSDELWSLGVFAIGKACDKYSEDSKASFTTYATRAIINEFRNWHRSEKKHLTDLYLDNKIDDESSKINNYYNIIGGKEVDIDLKLIIEDAVQTLRPFEQEIVRLMMQGYEYKTIATIQGVSKQAMSTRIFRIRQKLAEELKELKGVY